MPHRGYEEDFEEDREPRRGQRGPRREFDRDMEMERGMQSRNGQHRRFDEGERFREAAATSTSAFGEALGAMMERSAAVFSRNLRAVQDESMKFTMQRIEQDVQAIERMARSRNFLELINNQNRWLTGLASDYGEQFVRMSQLMSSAASEAGERFPQQRSRMM